MNATHASLIDGATQVIHDLISPAPATALAAALDRNTGLKLGDALPPIWHWLYFWSVAQQSDLGADGHPRTGGFLPDLGLPRRMAAGGRLFFHSPLRIGDAATRTSRVLSIENKEGRSGRLAFVTVEHAIAAAGHAVIREEQDIVYREAAEPGAPPPRPQPAPSGAHWQREILPSEALLFRYSALTTTGTTRETPKAIPTSSSTARSSQRCCSIYWSARCPARPFSTMRSRRSDPRFSATRSRCAVAPRRTASRSSCGRRTTMAG
jgi:3-methylfumaryl-CoA hydratase